MCTYFGTSPKRIVSRNTIFIVKIKIERIVSGPGHLKIKAWQSSEADFLARKSIGTSV